MCQYQRIKRSVSWQRQEEILKQAIVIVNGSESIISYNNVNNEFIKFRLKIMS